MSVVRPLSRFTPFMAQKARLGVYRMWKEEETVMAGRGKEGRGKGPTTVSWIASGFRHGRKKEVHSVPKYAGGNRVNAYVQPENNHYWVLFSGRFA